MMASCGHCPPATEHNLDLGNHSTLRIHNCDGTSGMATAIFQDDRWYPEDCIGAADSYSVLVITDVSDNNIRVSLFEIKASSFYVFMSMQLHLLPMPKEEC